MTPLQRYLACDMTGVYHEIYSLGKSATDPDNLSQIHLVLTETFKRVAFNLDVIHRELVRVDYKFAQDKKYDWQKPLSPPDTNVDFLLSELKLKINGCGQIPLSLEYFYKIVGSCNFCWDWETHPDIPWEGAAPLDIPPLDTLLSEQIYDNYDRNDILLAGDYLQKDNISGSGYNIELLKTAAVDSLISGWDMPFIEYLRLTMKNCGFTRADQCAHETLDQFCNTVKPKLLEI